MCDFYGYVAPEMVKVRPVVIVSPKDLPRPGLYTVVPLSTSEPNPIEKYHFKLVKNPMPQGTAVCWAKCDMVATVSIQRLDRIKVARGKYVTTAISDEELKAIRECLKHSLGIT